MRLPGGWRTQNPFGSTYFAAQAMAAEMSTGAPGPGRCGKTRPASVSMLIVGLRASYAKTAHRARHLHVRGRGRHGGGDRARRGRGRAAGPARPLDRPQRRGRGRRRVRGRAGRSNAAPRGVRGARRQSAPSRAVPSSVALSVVPSVAPPWPVTARPDPARSCRGAARLGTGVRAATISASKTFSAAANSSDAPPERVAGEEIELQGGIQLQLVAVVLVGRARPARLQPEPQAALVAGLERRLVPRHLRQAAPLERGVGREARHARVGERVAGGQHRAAAEAQVELRLQAARARAADVLALAGDEARRGRDA